LWRTFEASQGRLPARRGWQLQVVLRNAAQVGAYRQHGALAAQLVSPARLKGAKGVPDR